jgi:hypothetical protein
MKWKCAGNFRSVCSKRHGCVHGRGFTAKCTRVVRLNDLAELTVQTDGQMQSAQAAQLLLSKRIDDLLHRFS